MKKKKQSFLVILVLLIICLLVYFFFPQPSCSLSFFDKRAVWLSYSDLSKLSYTSKKTFRQDFLEVIENVKAYQGNTLIVQVRAFGDALYESSLYPLSTIITHQSTLTFDPLTEMCELAHQQGLSIEAWINPYRVSLNQESYQQFIELSPHRSWLNDPQLTIGYATYQYIFNPASQKVRDYIVDGVEEVVKNYDVDGIHFDDYFYVSGTHGKTSQGERMDNVNMLVQDVYQSIKAIDQDVIFGISPQGNYENCLADGADVETWLKEEGYVDYVMPQLYWSDQYGADGNTKMFTQRCQQFAKLEKRQDVMLYAGLALYRAGEDIEQDQGWQDTSDNISKQIQKLYDHGYKGYSLFRYDSFLKEAGQKELENMLKRHA